MKRSQFGIIVALSLLLLGCPADGGGGDAQVSTGRELIRDRHFQNGFLLLAPQPGRRVVYGQLPGLTPGPAPAWDLGQWSTKYPFASNVVALGNPDGAQFTHAGKQVIIGRTGTTQADLTMQVWASAEYGSRARKSGEPWVHLLAQQEFPEPPPIARLTAARFHLEARLQRSELTKTADYTPSLHAAQFQVFFTVQNRNRQSPGYGRYLWFGIPVYDDRQRVAPGHKARDTGGTDMFIYTLPGDTFSARSAHDRDWITLDKDLLPLMREALQEAWTRGFLQDSRNITDYCIGGMNLGWEVPGIFDVSLQIRNLSLRVQEHP